MRLNPRLQGDLGERSAMLWFGAQGAGVFVPLFHSPDYDLIADWGEGVARVQVKTATGFRNNRWEVQVCTRGGNQSWNGLVKRLDPLRYDYLFVLVGDGRRWLIPAQEVGGGIGILLGGPRYAEFEIDPDPIGLRAALPASAT
jgi:PD-(D/E)XK endonuclease